MLEIDPSAQEGSKKLLSFTFGFLKGDWKIMAPVVIWVVLSICTTIGLFVSWLTKWTLGYWIFGILGVILVIVGSIFLLQVAKAYFSGTIR